MADNPTAPGPVACNTCNATAHLARSPITGRMLAVDDPDDINTVHLCVLARPVAVLRSAAGTVTVAPLNGAHKTIEHILGGRMTGPADRAEGVVRRLAGRGVVVLLAGFAPQPRLSTATSAPRGAGAGPTSP